jgi:Transglutaminase-like superfamily
VALPDVEPGSIVEYRFERHWHRRRLEAASLILQQDLFTREARFSMIAIGELFGVKSNFTWVGVRLPRDHSMHTIHGGFELDAKNIAALPDEEFAPPEEEASSRVDYFYSPDFGKGHEDFWLEAGKYWNTELEKFAGRSAETKRLASETVAASDTPEEKLRKIYARVQKIRNLSGERDKTEKEIQAEKLKENQTADDVIEHGYASWFDVDWVFVVMARAAGLQADPAYVAKRDGAAFSEQEHNVARLNGIVIVAMAGPQTIYLDPGCARCPFGLLP